MCLAFRLLGLPLLEGGIFLGPKRVPAIRVVEGDQRAAAVVVMPLLAMLLSGFHG
jgi:hypothetical protein